MIYYVLFSLIGIGAAFFVSRFLKMPKPNKTQQLDVFIAGGLGLIIGAKLPVWFSYGFSESLIFSGKSVMGGLLGAFICINIYKWISNQKGEAFGGRFVIPLAVAIGFGKIGCFLNGCCGGNFFIPIQLVESAFQFMCATFLTLYYLTTKRIDLLFPLYLLAYLIMRFFVEFMRVEPRLLGGLTIYQYLTFIFVPIFIFILYQRKGKNK